VEECGPYPVFVSFTLAFALQLRKKHRKTSVRVRKTSVRLRKTSVRGHIRKTSPEVCRYRITLIAHTTIILPVILYSYETWFLILGVEYRLTVTENRILRRKFGPKREEVTGG
jgi:hypothetical protein